MSLKQIADELGISVSSVSRALGSGKGVTKSRKREVEETAARLGVNVNRQASALRKTKKSGLALLFNPNDTEIGKQRNKAINELVGDYYSHLRMLGSTEMDNLDVLVQEAIAAKSEAILIHHLDGNLSEATINLLKNTNTPCIAIDCEIDSISQINFDRSIGAYMAIKLLSLSGCQSPCCLFSSPCEGRAQGAQQAIQEFYPDKTNMIHSISGRYFVDGEQGIEDVLSRSDIDGIFCWNDEVALGVMRKLQQLDIRVPHDIKVIGFDNLPFSAYLPVSLTTVAQPIEEPVRLALSYLQKCDGFEQDVNKVLSMSLVVRESAPIKSQDVRKEIFS
ncbi:MAG: LacI family transcriptional regulator [Lentisphaeria bacterium]|nr:LacI family transcriptional regulator [Lentisphaeria bacterium]